MSRYLPLALDRQVSREEGRPTRCGAWRWNRQRWFRQTITWRPRMGSGACGRFGYLSRYDI